MRQQLVNIIKWQPLLYRALIEIITCVQTPWARWRGTASKEKYWSERSIGEAYRGNWDHPSKHFLAERIAAFSPMASILEVGCASGPNLFLLSKKFPQAQLTGIDINQEAIQYGNRRFAEEGVQNVRLLSGKADELGQFLDGSFDIVFTNALLIYIGPDKIKQVIKEMIRISRKALVLIELNRFDGRRKNKSGPGICRAGNWIRDYSALLKQFVSEKQIHVVKIPEKVWPAEPWITFGAVIEVALKQGK